MSLLDTHHRMVIVTRKFWPWADDASHRLLQMIDGLRSRGIEADVLTARWHPSWPEHAQLRGANVTRLLPPPKSNWNEGHFQKNVVAWLRLHSDEYRTIYVDRADGLLASIVAKASKWNRPVIARYDTHFAPHGMARGQHWPIASAADACRRVDRVLVPHAHAHRQLISEGIDQQKIVRIPDWVEVSVDRQPESRRSASAALFQVSSDFVIPGRTELIVHYGEAETKELMTVVRGVCDLLDQGASLRFWILASGSSHSEVHDLVKDRGWHREILLFDGFDDLVELAEVADLVIVSNPAATLQFSSLTFLRSEIPMIVLETPETRSWVPDVPLMKYYTTREDLVRQLQDWQIHRQQWLNEATSLRIHMDNQTSTARSLDLWEGLLKPLTIGS